MVQSDAVPRHQRRHVLGLAGARAALDRLRARLRPVGPLLRLPDRAARSRDRDPRVPALAGRPERRRSGDRARAADDPASRCRQPQRRAAAVRPRRQAVAGNGRRRRRQRPVRPLAGPARRCWASCCGSTPPRPVAEIVARGLRNPWRFSFDRTSGQLVIADVGQGAMRGGQRRRRRQLRLAVLRGHDTSAAGPPRRATARAALPVLTKSHADDGFCAIVGGYVVRDPGLPTLLGRYVYGDNCATGLRSVDLASPAGDAAIGPLGAVAERLRRGRLRPHPGRLAQRAGLPPRRRHAAAVRRRRPGADADPHAHRDGDGDRHAVRNRRAGSSRHSRFARSRRPAMRDLAPGHRARIARTPQVPVARPAHRQTVPATIRAQRFRTASLALVPGARSVVKLRLAHLHPLPKAVTVRVAAPTRARSPRACACGARGVATIPLAPWGIFDTTPRASGRARVRRDARVESSCRLRTRRGRRRARTWSRLEP